MSLRIQVGPLEFDGRWEEERSPRTCAALRALLPLRGKLRHGRWSGEAGWVPMGNLDLGAGYERPTSYPQPGQILWHPPDLSEAELLIPYGPTRFASQTGQLAGNHCITLLATADEISAIGELLLAHGAQPFVIADGALPGPA
jgi:hypothetical protein